MLSRQIRQGLGRGLERRLASQTNAHAYAAGDNRAENGHAAFCDLTLIALSSILSLEMCLEAEIAACAYSPIAQPACLLAGVV